jgi:pimeloyl-ACP methyl ester carboxylesterase
VIPVRGVPTYLESAGQGAPLLYLHGATEWVGYSADFVSQLQRSHRVVQPERRGHGRTPDVPGDLTFQIMADDTIALIEQLGLHRPDLVGFSDGANIALMVAMSRPDLVGKIVAIGPNMSVAAFTEETRAWLDTVTPQTWPAEYRQRYEALSPDGAEHWPVFAAKVIDMVRREPEIPCETLGAITAPTLVIGADRDIFRLEHFIAIYRAIPDCELSIIPGAGHELTVEQPTLTAAQVLRFLDQDPHPRARP